MRPRVSGPRAAALGLALCYLANDTEEVLTYARSARDAAARLPGWVPLPESLRHGVSQRHITIAVAAIGGYWVGAAVDGWRTDGRSRFFQDALWAWGAHGFSHLAMSAARGGYTSGVATAPLVLGYWWWAERTLRRAGVPRVSSPVRATAKGLAVLAAPHAVAALVDRGLLALRPPHLSDG